MGSSGISRIHVFLVLSLSPRKGFLESHLNSFGMAARLAFPPVMERAEPTHLFCSRFASASAGLPVPVRMESRGGGKAGDSTSPGMFGLNGACAHAAGVFVSDPSGSTAQHRKVDVLDMYGLE